LFTSLGAAFSIGLVWLTHSMSPIAVYVFGTIFWTTFHGGWKILTTGGYLNEVPELMTIFFIAAMLAFIAAVIGMVSGSG